MGSEMCIRDRFVGRASRVNMLSDLIGYMLAHSAWIDTNKAVAEYVLKQEGLL